MELKGYDGWKTTEPDDRYDDSPRAYAYRCLDCEWSGRGGVGASAHHQQAHHRIVLRDDRLNQPLVFACCQPTKGG